MNEQRQPVQKSAHHRVHCGIALVAFALLACSLIGCVSVTEHKTLRSANTQLPQTLRSLMPPAPNASAPVYSAPISPKPLYLIWDNPNPAAASAFLLLDVWATTDLTKPFAHWAYASGLTNALAFMPTNQAQFFIARFARTNTSPWEYSEWNTKL